MLYKYCNLSEHSAIDCDFGEEEKALEEITFY